jgi:hypothetical protein
VVVIKSRNCDTVEIAVQCGKDIDIAARVAMLGLCPIPDPSKFS